MKIRIKDILFTLVAVTLLWSCDDNDTFSTSYNSQLTFATQTLSLDTVFSKVPSASKMFKIYNRSGDGIRISSIRQERGAAKSGFRVNVNGMYISPDENNTINSEIEFRNGDSIRVWVELTTPKETGELKPQEINDRLLFTLESGRQQEVGLKAWAWDADTLCNHFLAKDTVIDNKNGRPLIVYGPLVVQEGYTLTVNAGSQIYFQQDGQLLINGSLKVKGTAQDSVVFRCDRLDSLIQLKYDQIPGKWQGVTLTETSSDNEIQYLDLHGAEYGILCDSTETYTTLEDMPQKLTIAHSSIQNCSGIGLQVIASKVSVENCLLANLRGNCLRMQGGDVSVNSTTIASFYGYTAGRQHALSMSDYTDDLKQVLFRLRMTNSIVTGYSEDEVFWYPKDMTVDPDLIISRSYLRTPEPSDEYSKKLLQDCLYDANSAEEYQGKGLFTYLNETGTDFRYDFTPRQGAPVIGAADPATSASDDLHGNPRKATPDMGCIETKDE